MSSGWQGESKRHSIAKKYGRASSVSSRQSPLSSFTVNSIASYKFGKQMGDTPFKFEVAEDAAAYFYDDALKDPDKSVVRYKVVMMSIEEFIRREYQACKYQGLFKKGSEPELSYWSDENNPETIEIANKMREGVLFPAPVIERREGVDASADGKHRVLAAKKLGYPFVPVIVFSLKSESV